ncbi:MAG: hypothetical protein HQ505_09065 [Nitrosopumilus sp.]|nr:hypothetical protein [Nitrosopumilus sp.]
MGLSLDGYDPDSLEGSSLAAKDIIRSNEYEVRVIVNTMDYAPEPLTTEEQIELNERADAVAPLPSTLNSDASGYEFVGPPKGVSWDDFATADPLIPDSPQRRLFLPTPPGLGYRSLASLMNRSPLTLLPKTPQNCWTPHY